MSTGTVICAVCLAILAAAVPSPVHAQWIEDGTAICTEYNDQDSHVIIPDGNGGAFIAWRDYRTTPHVYVQRLDAWGYPLWDPGGVRVTDVGVGEFSPSLAVDGDDGVIVVWAYGGLSWDIHAQRLDADGNRLWGTDGVVVNAESGVEGNPLACSDLAGGAVVAWEDDRNGDMDIYAQRIDGTGSTLWGSSGIALCNYNGQQSYHDLVSDGMGGAFVCWTDYRIDADIYVNRVTFNGSIMGSTSGVAVCSVAGYQGDQVMTADGAGGAIIAWKDARGVDYDIYAQRIRYDCGNIWNNNGVPVCTVALNQDDVQIVSDGEWGAIIAWSDSRDYGQAVYAQRLSQGGNNIWAADGIDVCPAALGGLYSSMCPDGEGGAIIAWMDSRSMVGTRDIYAQCLDPYGQNRWAADGVALCTSVFVETELMMATDGAGGAIACWQDGRNEYYFWDIYAQRVERNGHWGYPCPEIVSVRDVPGDQGGYVSLSWDASRFNVWPEDGIGTYEIWRALDEETAMAMIERGAARIMDPAKGPVLISGPSADSEILRENLLSGEPYYWHLVTTVDAVRYMEHYSEIVGTLFDSTDVSSEYHYWQVVAYDLGGVDYWYSRPDSGYSTDDLAPAVPLGLTGEQMFLPDGLQLTWAPNVEPDLAEYRVYRGESPGFEPGPGNLVGSTPDTITFDEGWDWAAGYWYKVSAVDEHGNESVFAVLGPDLVTGDDPMPAPERTFLAQNYPNPFNPGTTIAFGLKERGHVSLNIYDAAGRLVRSLADRTMDAGKYELPWNGLDDSGVTVSSGVYFYMLRAKEFEKTKKMILLR